MTPKSPDELREELERQNEQPAKPGHERTAEGMEVPIPSKHELLDNLKKLSGVEKRRE
jgi:hypothetical protein